MKYYLLSIIQPDRQPPPPDVLRSIMSNVEAFKDELRAADVLVLCGSLEPVAASKVVRPQTRRTFTTDGPYIETKEVLGGLCVIKAPDLESAVAWGEKAAMATTLPIEVRAFEGKPEARPV